ncbi:putative mucin-5AC-like [Apostichopus japonicus]|uniref:Putative mucin-5AC-like n=1 Tax=Stichopus japonicus TaxID=307972 RepID=A0A2G8JAW7_STIJA|nr:putative mucin-5AC-like [Apostichopus japonicus]
MTSATSSEQATREGDFTLIEEEYCQWEDWCDDENLGTEYLYQDEIENKDSCGQDICLLPIEIECVSTVSNQSSQAYPWVTCHPWRGLYCNATASASGYCENFMIRFKCCYLIHVTRSKHTASMNTTSTLGPSTTQPLTTNPPTTATPGTDTSNPYKTTSASSHASTGKPITTVAEHSTQSQGVLTTQGGTTIAFPTPGIPSTHLTPSVIQTTTPEITPISHTLTPSVSTSTETGKPITTITEFSTETQGLVTTQGSTNTVSGITGTPSIHLTPSVIQTTSPEITPSSHTVTASVSSPLSTPEQVTTPGPTICYENCYWTDWCDDEDPTIKFLFTDENEDRNSCQEEVCETPVEIECQTSDGTVPVNEATYPLVSCEVHTGLHCDASLQGICSNFKVRYKCCNQTCSPVSHIPEETSTIMQTSKEISEGVSTISDTPEATSGQPTTFVVHSTQSQGAVTTQRSTNTVSGTPSIHLTPSVIQTTVTPSSHTVTPSVSSTTETGKPITTVTDFSTETQGLVTTQGSTNTVSGITGTPSIPLTPSVIQTTSPEITPSSHTVTASVSSPLSTPEQSTTPGPIICYENCYWTDWCDDEDPTIKFLFTDENEDRNSCQEEVCETPVEIECQTSDGTVPVNEATYPLVSCEVHTGLHCDASLQGICSNFKVRYKCCNQTCSPVSHIPEETSTIMQTSKEISEGVSTTSATPEATSGQPTTFVHHSTQSQGAVTTQGSTNTVSGTPSIHLTPSVIQTTNTSHQVHTQ